jgi:hypothetical protein
MRSVFNLPAGWRGPTFAVPWLAAYFASQFPVVFVQESYHGDVDNQRYRFEVHNPHDLEDFKAGLSSSRFARGG